MKKTIFFALSLLCISMASAQKIAQVPVGASDTAFYYIGESGPVLMGIKTGKNIQNAEIEAILERIVQIEAETQAGKAVKKKGNTKEKVVLSTRGKHYSTVYLAGEVQTVKARKSLFCEGCSVEVVPGKGPFKLVIDGVEMLWASTATITKIKGILKIK